MKYGAFRYVILMGAAALAALAAAAAPGNGPFAPQAVLFADDFEDGDLAKWAQGEAGGWTASPVNPITGTRSLKHNPDAVAGTNTIVAHPDFSLADGETTWRFNLRNGSFDPSAGNRFHFFLVSDRADLSNAPNGYAVGVNLAGQADLLTLWRVTAGAPTALIVSDLNWDPAQTVGVEVTRTADGQWSLAADPDGGFDNLAWKGGATDTADPDAAYMGLVFVFTDSNAGLLRLDDLSVAQGTGAADAPPSLQLAPAGTRKSVRVGNPVIFSVTALEPANDAADTIVLRALSAPAGAVFPECSGLSPLPGTFAWTPAKSGLYTAVFAASDKDGTNTLAVQIEATALAEGPAWINEFHYDNAGVDAGEGVELAGRTGTDLSEFILVLYNGNDAREYGQTRLSGRIDEEQDGFGAVWFDVTGIQNGAPDGMALIRVQGGRTNLLQFLSYEGEFIAGDGPAAGVLSRAVGVAEPDTTPAGRSLQLIGCGRAAADFTWSGPCEHSRGRLNPGQTLRRAPTMLFVQ